MSDIIGCGIDIEDLSRFIKHIPEKSELTQFVKLIFTSKEIESHSNFTPGFCIPIGFSCKEAIFKAFGISWTNSPINWKDIEIIFSDKADPKNYQIQLNKYALQLFHEKEIKRIESSFDMTSDFVTFEAILIN
jgi:phosphopantetheine--protein transferase-like protein